MGEKKKKLFVHPNCYHIWVDGSFRPPDNAACAYLIYSERQKKVVKAAKHAFRGMSINQMELMAVNKALDNPNMDYVLIYSDSTYVISCFTLWRKLWVARNWLSPTGEPIKNRALIEEICRKIDQRKFVGFIKVKAHTGDPYNSFVDYLAQTLTKEMTTNTGINNQEYVI